jgi:hypothetical protein
MRFKVIMLLALILAVAMGMQDAKANISEKKADYCSAAEAYKLGQEGKERPDGCAIGRASVAHDSWSRGYHDRISQSGNVQISKKTEISENIEN